MGGYLAGRLRTKWAGYSQRRGLFQRHSTRFSRVGDSVRDHRCIFGNRCYYHDRFGFNSDESKQKRSNSIRRSRSKCLFRRQSLSRGCQQTGRNECGHPKRRLARSLLMHSRRGRCPRRINPISINWFPREPACLQLKPINGSRISSPMPNRISRLRVRRQPILFFGYFLALLIGAFCASFSATIGGRQRDNVVTV